MFKNNFKNNFKSMTWKDMEPVISELTQWSGSLTCLASDLGQAHQSTSVQYLSRRLSSDYKDVDLYNTRKRYTVIESLDLMRNISWLALFL